MLLSLLVVRPAISTFQDNRVAAGRERVRLAAEIAIVRSHHSEAFAIARKRSEAAERLLFIAPDELLAAESFARTLDDMAQAAGLTVLQMDRLPARSVDERRLLELPIDMRVAGSAGALTLFLRVLEDGALVVVESLHIERAPPGLEPDADVLRLSVRLVGFTYPPAEDRSLSGMRAGLQALIQ